MNRSSCTGKCVITSGGLAPCGCLFLALIALYLAVQTFFAQQCLHSYYVDNIGGSDTNSGKSELKPWKTLAPVHTTDFLPGSAVYFKRGSSWTEGLLIDDLGVEGEPIVFAAYGVGDRPVFTNPGGHDNRTSVVVIDADWIVLEGLLVRDAYEAGVYITKGSDNNIVRDVEATNVGTGIVVDSQYNLVTRSYLHDLHMVKNTPGGNDDYGAVGIRLSNAYNQVSYNRMVNCIAPSYDYDVDGGGIEWWGIADGNYVHHNWVAGSAGFLEVGGGSASNTIVAYNVSVNNGRFSSIHLSGQFASDVENFRLENNTIVETATDDTGWAVLDFGGEAAENTFLLRNNILHIEGFKFVSNKSGFTHDHNLYYLKNGIELGFTLGQGEEIADPLFANLARGDFHLLPASPAVDAGVRSRI